MIINHWHVKKTMIIKDMNESVSSSFLYFMGEDRERWDTGKIKGQPRSGPRSGEGKKPRLGFRGGATKKSPTWAQGRRGEKPPDLGPGVVRKKSPTRWKGRRRVKVSVRVVEDDGGFRVKIDLHRFTGKGY